MGHTAKFAMELSMSPGIELKNVWSVMNLLVHEISKSIEYLQSY